MPSTYAKAQRKSLKETWKGLDYMIRGSYLHKKKSTKKHVVKRSRKTNKKKN